MVAILRRWADALERHLERVGDEAIGPAWPEADLVELYDAWLSVGAAIRGVARSRPSPVALDPRPEVVAVRDGLERIAEIVERQV